MVIRSELAFPLDLLTQLRQKHSRLIELQLFELSVIRSDFYSPWGQLWAKSPWVIRIFLMGRSPSESIDFLRFKHFFTSKNHVSISIIMAIYTLQAISSKDQYSPSVQRKQTGNHQSLIISKFSSFPWHLYFASTQHLWLQKVKYHFGKFFFFSFILHRY